ncbi:unnamed protein product, partial [Pylaiella littoralis]
KIPERYNHLQVVGKGSYGVVCSAIDSVRNNAAVAIKKISPMAAHSVDAKHVLREVRVMRHLGNHENIVTLEDLFCNEAEDELYIVMELLESDLHRIIQSKQVLSMKHHRVFMIQILRGVEFLHKNGVIHRDLKPGNILLTRNCELRISDFGLARELPKDAKASAEARQDGEGMTEHVVTRWYRPPELMLSPNGFYGFPVDIWSVGCIFGELLGRRPLFPGSSFVDQLSLIFDVLGAPAPKEVSHIRGAQARKFLDKLRGKTGVTFSDLLPGTPGDATSLLKNLLLFDPLKRCMAGEALRHPFFDDLREDAVLEVAPPAGLEFEFERKGFPRSRLKELIAGEINHFQAGGANLTLHPKAILEQQQQQQRLHRNQGPSSSRASGDTPVNAIAATVAAAARSSAPFSSEGDDDDDDDDIDYDDDDDDDDDEGGGSDPGKNRGCSDSDGAKDTKVLHEMVNGIGGCGVAYLDAASLQSSRLCPKHEGPEKGGGGSEGDTATDDDGDRGYGSEGSSREGGMVAMVVSMNAGDDEVTVLSLPPGTSLSLLMNGGEHRRCETGGNGWVAQDHQGCTKTYWENKQMKKQTATEGERGGRRPLCVGTACRSLVRARGNTQDSGDFPPILEEEALHDSITPSSQTGRDNSNGSVDGVRTEKGGEQSLPFPQFDSLDEISVSEASESVRCFVTSPVSVPVKPAARLTSVAGFVRGSDGWDNHDADGNGGDGSNGKRSKNLAVSHQSPPSLQDAASLGLQSNISGDGSDDESESSGCEEEQGEENNEREHVLGGASVQRGGGRSKSSYGPEVLRRERAKRAWQMVGEARAGTKATADAAAAATTAAGTGASSGRGRNGRPAPILEGTTRSRGDIRTNGNGRSGGRAMPSATAIWPPSKSPTSGSSWSPSRRNPVSSSLLLQENQSTAWLCCVSNASKPTTCNCSSASSGGTDKKHAPSKRHPSPEMLNSDPFGNFPSDNTSLVTYDAPFCDYLDASTAMSLPAVPAPAAQGSTASTTAAAAAAPAVPAGVGGQFPVMKVGQTLQAREPSAAAARNQSSSQRRFFGGSDASKADRHPPPPRAPVASIQQEHLNPSMAPARRFNYPKPGKRATSVASSLGSPPPVPPPLGQRYVGNACARSSSSSNRSGDYRALRGVGANGCVRTHAAAVVVNAGSGRGRQGPALPPPIATALRMKLEGGGRGGDTKRAHLSPTAAGAAAAAAEKLRASVTPMSGGASTAAAASPNKYYSVHDVVTLKLPERLLSPSPTGSGDIAPLLNQTQGENVGAPPSLISHNQPTTGACDRPTLIPTRQAWNWVDKQAAPAAASAGEVGSGSGGGSEQPRSPQSPTTSPISRRPSATTRATCVVSATAVTVAAAASAIVADDGKDGGSGGGGDRSSTSARTTITPSSAAVTALEEETAAAPSHKSRSLTSAMFTADSGERRTAAAKQKNRKPLSRQLNKPWGLSQGAPPLGAGPKQLPEGVTCCSNAKEEEVSCDIGGGGSGGGGMKAGDDGMNNDLSPASAERKFTLLRRLWKRSIAGKSIGRQGCGDVSSIGRTAAGGGATSFDAGPSPKLPRPQQARSRGAKEKGAWDSSRNVFEGNDGQGHDDKDGDVPPGPVLLSQAASSFPAPQKIALQVLQQTPVVAVAAAAAAVIPSAAEKSHKRSVSNATSHTCGTSPASSATSGFRGDGSQALLLFQHHSGGSGLSPTGRRGSGIGYAAAAAASASLRSEGGRRRPRRDNIVRAVQFAEE